MIAFDKKLLIFLCLIINSTCVSCFPDIKEWTDFVPWIIIILFFTCCIGSLCTAAYRHYMGYDDRWTTHCKYYAKILDNLKFNKLFIFLNFQHTVDRESKKALLTLLLDRLKFLDFKNYDTEFLSSLNHLIACIKFHSKYCIDIKNKIGDCN